MISAEKLAKLKSMHYGNFFYPTVRRVHEYLIEVLSTSAISSKVSVLLIFLSVFLIGLVSRVRPWDPRAYYSGDLMPWWPTDDPYFWDITVWTNQDGGTPSGMGGSVLAWALRWLAVRGGMSAAWLDGVTYALPPAIGATGVVLLLRTLGVVGAGTTLAAAHYAFNLEWVINTADAAQWARAMAPWLAWGIVQVNRWAGGPNAVRAAFGFAVIVVTFGSAGSVNLPQVVIVGACAVLWLISRTWWDLVAALDLRAWLQQWALTWGMCAVFTVLLGGWLIVWNVVVWLLPVLGVGGGMVTAPTSVQAWGWTHANASFGNLIVGLGTWAWREEYFGVIWVLTESVPGRLLIGVPFIVALLAQFANQTIRTGLVTLVLLLVIFLMKGVHEPFSIINKLMYIHMPGMQLLREPVSKLGFVWLLLNAVLLAVALSAQKPATSSQRSWRTIGLILAWVSVGFTATLRVREVRDVPTSLMPSAWVEVPADWHGARTFIAGQRVDAWGRTLVLPKNDYYAVPYVWGGYFFDGLAPRFLGLWQVQSVNGYFDANPASAQATEAIYAALALPVADCADIAQASLRLGVGSALVRYDIGSRGARPLGSGPAQVAGPTRASEILEGCGWHELYRNDTLQLLTAPTSGPRPVGAPGATVDIGAGVSPVISSTVATISAGSASPPIATTMPSGYGFALLECSRDGDCGALALMRAWIGGRFEWCQSRGVGEWCDFPSAELSPGVHVVRNALQDVYFVLLLVGAVTLVGGTTWAVWPWVGRFTSAEPRTTPKVERK